MKNSLLFIFILMGSFTSFAQEKLYGFFEPFITLEYDVNDKLSQEFTLENRTIWYDKENVTFEIKQFDLAHFSKLKLNDENELAAGIQYRFRENFGRDEENELRFTEEYTFSAKPKATEFKHRLRAEQRFTSSETSHRFRYNLAINRSFNGTEIKKGNTYVIGDMETLLTIAKTNKPEYEQRLGAGVGWALSDHLKIEIVTEYRLSDFTRNLVHELYLVTGMKISL